MSLSEETMAVEAPIAGGTSAGELAHLPKVEGDNGHALHVVADHQGKGVGDEMLEPEYIVNGATNGKGRKRSASPSQTENNKKAKLETTNGTFSKKKNIVESDDEDEDVAMRDGDSEDDKPLTKTARASTSVSAKQEPESSSEEDIPLASTNGVSKPPTVDESDLSEDEKPLAKTTRRAASRNSTVKSEKTGSSDLSDQEAEESSDEDVPLAKKTKKAAAPKKAPAKKKAAEPKKGRGKAKKEESDSEEKPLKKGKAAPKAEVKDEKPKGRKKKSEAEQQQEEDDAYKWWEAQADGDGSSKWTTLEHNGVLFPPAYQPLPKNIRMKYDGKSVTLSEEAEEVAGFFAALLETDHAADKIFRKNFFEDWLKVLKEHPSADSAQIKDLEKCDFRPMHEYFEIQKDKKKQLTAAEKKRIKAERDEIEKPYLYATIDGRKEKVGNFRVEPPGLFRGRGEHPKKGRFKYRLKPEDIVINIGADAPVPTPNIEGNWKSVQHDNTVTWLAHWKENINGNSKYVFLSAGSTWKGQSDRQKFEKARELQKHVDRIRKDYTADLRSKIMADRQRATAMYLIDKLALRAGNEKGEDEADTVGCCSLRLEHVTLLPKDDEHPVDRIALSFLGKDSILYEQVVEVDPQVFKNIKIFKAEPKTQEDDLFDRLTTSTLNKHLGSYMPGLTAKVFRTYNASWTFQEQLEHTPKNGTVQEKIAAYNKANKDVAILCNHQKTVSKTHAASMEKLGDKLLGMKYQRMRLRYQLFNLDAKQKKKHPELAEDESDLEEEFFERHEKALLETAIDKATKKFERDNAKAIENKEEPQPESALKEKIKELKAENVKVIKERKAQKVEVGKADVDKILTQIKKMDERIDAFKVSLEDRESNKTVALGTSKINYIDPRLTVAWAKKHDVPLEKLFSKTLLTKFPWAVAEIESDPDWRF
ncbi:DNA topoisomerase 1 [Naganishia albida]|nr:DNA topoisomerase 1 [Naganishia albida]